MRIVAKAPCRVDLAGGTLDIWPLYLNHPNAVTVNFAIDRYTTCEIETAPGPITLRSNDQKHEERFESLDHMQRSKKLRLPLLAYVLRHFRPDHGLTMQTDSESPAGAGIAGSSSLIIAISSALNKLTRSGHNLEQIREISQNIEAQIIRVPTGAQDYYPALYGGVSAVELGCAGIRRVCIPVDLDDLTERTVLAYTGEPRNSGINNWEVTKAYIDGDRRVQRNFEQISAIANGMRAAVARSDWEEAGRLLREEWAHRRKNAPGITTPLIDSLVKAASKAGAKGAKVCGAGGGGCVFFLVERGAKEKVSAAVEKAGAEVLPVKVVPRGVTVKASG